MQDAYMSISVCGHILDLCLNLNIMIMQFGSAYAFISLSACAIELVMLSSNVKLIIFFFVHY